MLNFLLNGDDLFQREADMTTTLQRLEMAEKWIEVIALIELTADEVN